MPSADFTPIDAFFGRDEALIQRFYDLFFRETPALLHQIDHFMAHEDWALAAVGVHSLKGQLQYFPQPDRVAFLQQLEAMLEGDGSDKTNAQLAWASFAETFRKALAEETGDSHISFTPSH